MQINKRYFEKLNQLGKTNIPFFFLIDFTMQKPLVFELNKIPDNVFFEVPGYKKLPNKIEKLPKSLFFDKKPLNILAYKHAFDGVMEHLKHGDTYLLNLTFPTKVRSNLNLKKIFDHSHSMFRLFYKDRFVCFSPEIFIRIKNGIISSYPMKGTIKASIPNAEKNILSNPKEFAEHNTIVDLIRNDLSMVSKNVRVKRYRYIDHVQTHQGDILQVSSEVVGKLEKDYPSKIGSILYSLLPAGSISGAPKKITTDIILKNEVYDRGYYTGVFGVFDKQNLESAVMIRYIEKKNGQFFFKSGGGITAMSKMQEEYEELCDKVYLPIIQDK